jgi:hypothetical protein
MRRIFAVAALGVALFGAAACADSKVEPLPGSSASAAATSAAAPASDKAACAKITPLVDKSKSDFDKAVAAVTAAGSDQAKIIAAVSEAQSGMTKNVADVKAAASGVSDPTVKSNVSAFTGEIETILGAFADPKVLTGDAAAVQKAYGLAQNNTLAAKATAVKTSCEAAK